MNKLNAVNFTQVKINDAFWAPKIETNRKVTLPIEYDQCKSTGRIDAWKWKPGQPNEPHIFWDSDVAKWIEAAAYSLRTKPDKRLEAMIDEVVALMAKAQAPDGYLNAHYLFVEPDKRWTNLRDCHELYSAGHLIEGAVAYFQATGKRQFLDVMCKYVDHIDSVFGTEKGKKRGYCGHEEIELALVKLYRATGDANHLKLAKYFVDERGRLPHYFDAEARARGEKTPDIASHSYFQAHKPLREQSEAIGHAVRAMYIYSGMADVAAETGDTALLNACRRIWDNLTAKQMSVTGGIGPTFRNEGFSFDYDMPNEMAYNETCAAIGLVFWAHRMLHLDPDGRYADVMERALYNGVMSGVSLDGRHFFYANPLAAHPGVDPHGSLQNKDFHYRRSEWFGCACCPPNIARLLASFGSYIYSVSAEQVRINLFVHSSADMSVGGCKVKVEQKTEYPWNGAVAVKVSSPKPARFSLSFRIPAWCRKTIVKLNGKIVKVQAAKGYATITRIWGASDTVQLMFDMPVERVSAHPAIRQNAGRIALQKGPVVYCLEETDNGARLNDLSIPRSSRLTVAHSRKLLGGVDVIKGTAIRHDPASWKGAPYTTCKVKTLQTTFTAIPYFAWCNRSPGEMLVWLNSVP